MSIQPDNKRLMQQALLELRELKIKLNAVEKAKHEPIAVIGMGCRFPQADNPAAFWQLLHDGVDAVREIPNDRWDVDAYYDPNPEAPNKMYTRQGGYLDQVYNFDPGFFGIAPREAATMDPQQRLLLEVSWEALEHAGLAPERLAHTETGVYIGYMNRDYVQVLSDGDGGGAMDPYMLTGNSFSFIAGRLSYLLGTQGPSMVVASACSSSLVTVHLACQALRNRECELALAGGINLILHPAANIMLSGLRAISPDGRCKTFDASADGYGRGEGCGMVVLKRLSDALAAGDTILGVIRGSAVNHDGPSAGLTVPNGAAQEKLLRRALAAAEVSPDAIDYIEAHGTGTALGDPIEINALVKVFGQQRARPLLVGSAKTNVGHLEAAAGIVGLIKVLLAFQHETIPPHLHFHKPNPYIAWDKIPIQVTDTLTPWAKSDRPRLAGVSSFGLSGINAHLVVEEAPVERPMSATTERPLHLLTLSAKSEVALQALKERYIVHFADNPHLDLADVCFTANTGRDHFNHRLSVVAASLTDAQSALQTAAGSLIANAPKVAFLFTGQGAQYVNMGRELYATQPVFRTAMDRCDELLRPYLSESLLSVIYEKNILDESLVNRKSEIVNQTAYTQPALFAIEYALAELWQAWGVTPSFVMGHSVGEYVAACVAGVFSLADALKLIAARGRLMQALPEVGSMMAVMATIDVVADVIAPFAATVSIAAVNGPQNVVISGERPSIGQIAEQLSARGVKTTRLTVSHAFHSPLMEPMLADFAEVAGQITYALPRISLVSNLTGTLVRDEVTTPDYWCQHVRQPVLFAAGMATLAQRDVTAFVEIGPKPVLLGMGRQCLDAVEHAGAPTGPHAPHALLWLPSLRPEQEWRQLLTTLGALYTQGVAIDWHRVEKNPAHHRVVLPTYPFQRKRYVGFVEQGMNGLAKKRAQTPLIDLLNQGDAAQLAQLLTKDGGFSAEQQALLPSLLAALIREQQVQLTAHPQNGAQGMLDTQLDDGAIITNDAEPLWQTWQLTLETERVTLLAMALEQQIARVLGYQVADVPALSHVCPLLELGLDSLMGVELRNWVKQALNIELSMVDFLSGPSIDELAVHLHEQLSIADASVAISIPALNGGHKPTNGVSHLPAAHDEAIYPLAHGQQALWFIHQSAPESSAYNVGLAFQIHSLLDVEALRQAFQRLVNRHPALRTTFSTPQAAGELVQLVHPYQMVDFAQIDARWSTDELKIRVANAYAEPFLLAQGPLMRVRLFTRAADDHVLLITFHHIICDAWSTWTLLNELWTLYPLIKADAPLPPNLLALPVTTYGDFTRWQQ
ncbi:MAG: beta-ketoacyl synthase N-terminal-like domain-containing protein, partial [Chloroflexi bacterium]|nr:beta-ketoacyl synthase N-terminal-like domain-containing protein [Chloroflexota bacterium]